jgi:hypothetical protein
MNEQIQSKTILIHKHKNHCGGVGDFIRSALSFYSLAQRLKYDFFIDLSDNENFQQCFMTPALNLNGQTNTETIYLIGGIVTLQQMAPILEKFANNPKTYVIYSNAIGFEPIENLQQISAEFFDVMLKPSQHVMSYVNDLLEKHELHSDKYVSVHIRCGDKNMGNGNNASNDYRINVDDTANYEKINEIICNFKTKHNVTIPIVLHSDSSKLKNNFKILYPEYKQIDVEIQHVAENIGSNNLNSYISTMAEFYIIANAHNIVMLDAYSGFSHTASIINAKTLHVNFNSVYFNLYNANNIINM